jgi:AraC-like DNA-binding protein
VADAELELLPRLNAFTSRVRGAVQQHLAQGATLEKVASQLNLSSGTLRRRLREHGITYTNLVDDVRREQARRWLRQPEQNIAEIAYKLGFSHPPAFHRACKRWFQQSPSEYRDEAVRNPVSRLWRHR